MNIENNIYCPVKKVEIYAGSRLLDNLNGFTKFILVSLGHGYTKTQIYKTVGLGQPIVDEEIDYLHEIGFIDIIDSRVIISTSGSRYLEIQKKIEVFNQDHIKAQINLYDGNVYCNNVRAVNKETVGNKSQIFPCIVDRYIIQNDDYGNVKEFIQANFQDYFRDTDITGEDFYFQCRDIDGQELMYVPYKLTEHYDLCELGKENKYYKIFAERIIAKVQYVQYITELDMYRKLINELTKIDIEYEDLLSESGKNIVKLIYAESEMLKHQRNFWCDVILGCKIPNMKNRLFNRYDLQKNFPNSRMTIFELSVPNNWNQDVLNHVPVEEGRRNDITFIELDRRFQEVPFSAFEEVQ